MTVNRAYSPPQRRIGSRVTCKGPSRLVGRHARSPADRSLFALGWAHSDRLTRSLLLVDRVLANDCFSLSIPCVSGEADASDGIGRGLQHMAWRRHMPVNSRLCLSALAGVHSICRVRSTTRMRLIKLYPSVPQLPDPRLMPMSRDARSALIERPDRAPNICASHNFPRLVLVHVRQKTIDRQVTDHHTYVVRSS